MWTRRILKDKGKRSFKANYWKTVLIAFLVAAILGGGGIVGFNIAPMLGTLHSGGSRVQESAQPESLNANGYSQQELDALVGEVDSYDEVFSNTYGDEGDQSYEDIDHLPPMIEEEVEKSNATSSDATAFGIAALGLIGLFLLIVVAIIAAVDVFIVNPLTVGGARFALLNLNQPAKVREMGYAFDHNYRETVKTMFFRDLYTVLWGLLFVIPGIVKSYEYRMIPYLLAEDPQMTMDRAFAESKRMMSGNKWRAFVLDLSFIGWIILSELTLGILQIFYVGPYEFMTNAALYEELRYGATGPEGMSAAEAAGEVPVPPFAQEVASESESMWDDGADGLANKGATDEGAEA